MRVYIDSCLLIYAVESPATAGAPVLKAVADSPDGIRFAVSGLVWTECLVKPLRLGNKALSESFGDTLAEFEQLEFTQDVFIRAAELRAAHWLRTPDALHVACAVIHGCTEIWTNDTRLAKLSDRLQIRQVG